jgi:hypothetical protein
MNLLRANIDAGERVKIVGARVFNSVNVDLHPATMLSVFVHFCLDRLDPLVVPSE